MKFGTYAKLNLSLFDGSAAGDGGEGTAAQGEANTVSGNTRRGKSGDMENVVFGKQASAENKVPDNHGNPSDADRNKEPETKVTSNTLEDKRKSFRDLVNGEYKDIYTEETQRMIDRRFRETKNLEQQVSQHQPIIDMLMHRYKITDGDLSKLSSAVENDNAYWSEAAEEAGMSVEQYKQLQKLERENSELLRRERMQQNQQAAQQQLQKWYGESEELSGIYPDFDLNEEIKDPQFLSMLRAGVPVRHAYEVIHIDTIKAGVAQNTAKQTEKQVVDSIRAKGARPAENGTASQSAFTVKDDPSKWSRKDREEVARRVARGEIIRL